MDPNREALVEIVSYDFSWPDRFEEERAVLIQALKHWIVGTIEHIGSTAVRGLPAKPVIDIMAGVENLEASRPALAILEDLGYCYAPYKADQMHWFCKPSPSFRTHHLHLVPFNSQLWTEQIFFREHLRAHPDVASEYGALKQRLAQVHRHDREAYTNAKSSFIGPIIKHAPKYLSH
ncbi:MAG TPA: GrpB family protein [Desulfuromonadaceae bacterium]|nr:GrpB family protein [Desulfuromonadaceae bacterium]